MILSSTKFPAAIAYGPRLLPSSVRWAARIAEFGRLAARTAMKIQATLGILAAFTLLVGCATEHRGPAYRHEQEFRQQLTDSVPVKDWGYRIQEIRFSEDYRKALVIFAVPGKTTAQELILEDDGFGRYKGIVRDYDRVAAGKTGKLADIGPALEAGTAWVTISLPRK